MSNAIPPILVQIAADVSQLKAGLAQAEAGIKGMNSSVATANTGMQNMLASAKRMAGTLGVAFAATQVVQFGKDVVMAASSMNESISKVKVVFGESADAVFKFGDSAAKNMGMSNQAAIEAAGTYGNLFQAFGIGQGKANEMSTTLVQLAADLGSFNNTSTEEAINALRSGLSGETEPLKRFGVALNETTLKAKALEMGFGAIKGAMDPAIKAQVTYALVMEQTKLAQGDYARTADGTANTMKTLSAQFADAKVAIGNLVLPAFNALLKVTALIIPVIKKLADYFKDNKDAIKMLAIIVATATIGFYAFKAAVVVTKTVMTVYTAVTKAMAAGHTLAAIATLNFRGAMMMLNMAMRANPIGVIVTALTLVAIGFIAAYKKSETFRSVVISGVQVIINGFALLVQGIGKFVGMLAKIPGMGWAKGIADGAENASKSLKETAKNMDNLKKTAVKTEKAGAGTGGNGGTGNNGAGGGGAGGGGAGGTGAAEAKKKAEEIKKTLKNVADVYKDMNKVIANSEEQVANATKRRDEATFEANKKYKNEVAKANKRYNETIASEDKKLLEATAAAYKRHAEQVDSINKEYAKRTLDIEQKLQETITNVREKAAEKSADIAQKAAEKSADLIAKSAGKQQELIQKSIDRLRNAFASKTGFDLADAFGMKEFGGAATGEQLLGSMKQRLNDAKNLAEKAAFLQANGFSQTFIEQVVAAGPGIGNELADAILNASPETISALNSSFVEMEKVSNTGLDILAKSMNSGANLATDELRDAYAQVAVDLAGSLAEVNTEMTKSLAEVNNEMTKSLADANKNYSEAMAEAKATRDDKLAEAAKDLMEALAEANKNYKEAVGEAQKDLSEALADAALSLSESLIDIQKTYDEALDQIAKDTQERIDALREKLIELAKTLADLGVKQAGVGVLQNAPVYNPLKGNTLNSNTFTNTNTVAGVNAASGFNITQNISYPTASASEISAKTISAIKFGSTSMAVM
jgi:uncharacterized membrane protein YgcG